MPRFPLTSLVERFASRLRFPQLFILVSVLFLISFAIPFDPIPFIDEILLALLTVLLGSLKKRGEGEEAEADQPPIKDVTPRGS